MIKIIFIQLDMSDPLSVAAETKKGNVLLVFVDIRGEPTETGVLHNCVL